MQLAEEHDQGQLAEPLRSQTSRAHAQLELAIRVQKGKKMVQNEK
jgi:hypothetical protein